jgi:hypothetical protein
MNINHIAQITSSTTLTEAFDTYIVNAGVNAAPITVTLPLISTDGMFYDLVREDWTPYTVSVTGTSPNLIFTNLGITGTTGYGQTGNVVLCNQYRMQVHAYKDNWYIMNNTKISPLAGKVGLTGQTAAISSTNIFTTPGDGLYQVNIYMLCTNTAIGSLTATITWTDEGTTQSFTTGSVNLVNLNAFVQAVITIQCQAGTNIAYSTAIASLVGSPQYSLYIAVSNLF